MPVDSSRNGLFSTAPERPQQSDQKSLFFNALGMASGTLLSRILGLIRDIMIARYLTIDLRDAFIVAFRVPNLLRRLFAEGAYTAALVPILIETRERDPEAAKRLEGALMTVLFALTSLLAIGMGFGIQPILSALLGGRGYLSVAGKLDITVFYARLMLGFIIFIALSAHMAAVLQSRKRFLAVALGPCFFNMTLVIGFWFAKNYEAPSYLSGLLVSAGGLLQFLFLYWQAWRSGFRLSNILRPPLHLVLRLARKFLPAVLGSGLGQFSILMGVRFAAELPSGTHSYMYIVDRMIELPISLVAVSLGVAILPTLAQAHSENDKPRLSYHSLETLSATLFLALPASLGLALLARPMTEALFFGREFKMDEVVLTADLLRILACSILFSSVAKILAQGLYAVQKAWYPALASVLALSAQAVLSWVFLKDYGVRGLVFAAALTSFIHMVFLTRGFLSHVAQLDLVLLLRRSWRWLPGLLLLAALCLSFEPLAEIIVGMHVSRRILLLALIGIAASAYLVSAMLLRSPETQFFRASKEKR